jgi:hypothetical protein
LFKTVQNHKGLGEYADFLRIKGFGSVVMLDTKKLAARRIPEMHGIA